MRRRIAASVGFLGLIGAAWFGARDHVMGGEPPTAPPAAPTIFKTKVGTAQATVVIPQAESELLPLVPTAAVPMAVPATGSTFESLCRRLQPVLKKRFPKCGIELISHRDGIVIQGSAATTQQAAAIVAAVQTVVDLNSPAEHPQSGTVVNQLEIPGEAQVQLSIKIIEADRNLVNVAFQRMAKSEQPASKSPPQKRATQESESSSQSGAFSNSGVFSNSMVAKATAEFAKHPGAKTISEPTITVLSGHVGSLISGGEFALPTIVGVGEAKETTTSFRSFGTSIIVKPTVIDSEQVRLELTCESSRIDQTKNVSGFPGLNIRRATTQLLMQASQTAVMVLPVLPTNESSADPLEAAVRAVKQALDPAQKEKEPANSERCLFVTVTPEVLKPMETNEVLPQPSATGPHVGATMSYVPYSADWMPRAVPTPQMIRVEPPLHDLLLRTPLPNQETWHSPPLAPPFDPIQQLGGWQPMNAAPMPWPGAGPSNVLVSKPSRLEHLQIAAQNLEAAGLTDQVAEIQKEITLERTSEIRRELKRRERELETLQRQIEELRRSLAPEEVLQPE